MGQTAVEGYSGHCDILSECPEFCWRHPFFHPESPYPARTSLRPVAVSCVLPVHPGPPPEKSLTGPARVTTLHLMSDRADIGMST